MIELSVHLSSELVLLLIFAVGILAVGTLIKAVLAVIEFRLHRLLDRQKSEGNR